MDAMSKPLPLAFFGGGGVYHGGNVWDATYGSRTAAASVWLQHFRL